MGGGVIECRPNQLYNEDIGTCTYWQQVDTSKCPEFDGSFLMPEDKDENANEKRFFVSSYIEVVTVFGECRIISHTSMHIKSSSLHLSSSQYNNNNVISVEPPPPTPNKYANHVPVDHVWNVRT